MVAGVSAAAQDKPVPAYTGENDNENVNLPPYLFCKANQQYCVTRTAKGKVVTMEDKNVGLVADAHCVVYSVKSIVSAVWPWYNRPKCAPDGQTYLNYDNVTPAEFYRLSPDGNAGKVRDGWWSNTKDAPKMTGTLCWLNCRRRRRRMSKKRFLTQHNQKVRDWIP